MTSLGRTRVQRSHDCFLVAADLQFDIEISRTSKAREHVFQTCEFVTSALYIRVIGGRDILTINLWIVTQHSAPIAREAHVELESVAAAGQRILERCNGVFSRKFRLRPAHAKSPQRTNATVAKQQRT